MKRMGLWLLSFMVASCLPLLAADDGYYRYQFARLQYVQGDVVLQKSAEEEEAAEVNFVITEGNILTTREGKAEVYLGRGNDLRLDRWTRVEFVRLPQSDEDSTSLRVLEGSAYLRIRTLEREKDFEIHTSDASFYVLEEGLYRFDVSQRETGIAVFEGAGEVAGNEKSVVLERGERLIASNGDLGSTMRPALERDSFAAWNEERDALDKRSVSRGYLPSELAEYESELAENGRWVYERPWGYVWVPYIIYTDWRPYLYGRWVWYPVIGWTWVPYEPWGWSVFHFGRWHWRLGLGWYWIPTIYWGPAWVHWWAAYDYIGWVPLSYYNRPVVIINNYFYDRFYDSVYPVHSRALTIVRKEQLQAPRVHEVALHESQMASLSHLSLQAVRANELHALIKPASLRASPLTPSIKREVTAAPLSSSGISREGKVIRRGGLTPNSKLPGVKTSPSPGRLTSGSVRETRESQIRPVSPGRSKDEPVERRIRSENSPLPGMKVFPSTIQPKKNETAPSSRTTPLRQKDEENTSRPSRVSSSWSSAITERSRVERTWESRTSSRENLRSRSSFRSYPSMRPAPSPSRLGSSLRTTSSWRPPQVTRIPSSPAPRVSVPSFAPRSGGISPGRISTPSFSPRSVSPSAPSSRPSSGRVIKKN